MTAAEGEENPHRGWAALPPLYGTLENTEARLRDMMSKHPRVWLVASGMVPLTPLPVEHAAVAETLPAGAAHPARAAGERRSPRDGGVRE